MQMRVNLNCNKNGYFWIFGGDRVHKPFSKPIRRGFKDVLFIRLFRLWAQAREEGMHPILALQSEVEHQDFANFTGAACGCLFDLLEAQLSRSLVPGRCACVTPS